MWLFHKCGKDQEWWIILQGTVSVDFYSPFKLIGTKSIYLSVERHNFCSHFSFPCFSVYLAFLLGVLSLVKCLRTVFVFLLLAAWFGYQEKKSLFLNFSFELINSDYLFNRYRCNMLYNQTVTNKGYPPSCMHKYSSTSSELKSVCFLEVISCLI